MTQMEEKTIKMAEEIASFGSVSYASRCTAPAVVGAGNLGTGTMPCLKISDITPQWPSCGRGSIFDVLPGGDAFL